MLPTENQMRAAAYNARRAAGLTGAAAAYGSGYTSTPSIGTPAIQPASGVIGISPGEVDFDLRSDTGQFLDPVLDPSLQEASLSAAAIAAAIAAAAGAAGVDLPSVGLPGGEYTFGDILPGGAPLRVPDLPIGVNAVLSEWWTGTAKFMIIQDDLGKKRYFVTKKIRRSFLPDTFVWKEYRPKHPVVIGNKLTSRNLNKAMKVFNRYKKLHKSLHKVFPHKRR